MTKARPPALCAAFAALIHLTACAPHDPGSVSDASLDGPPWDVAEIEPVPRPGMVWIPPGVLIVGTPPDRLPRVADEEMPGEQVVMRGFYMDIYPYSNEVGAIPLTNVSQTDAGALCDAQQKRLCTELEMERACKGPDNHVYEYGDAYKAQACATGSTRALVPNGVNASCQSGFGVHDLHGGVWSWTSSDWGRGSTKPDLVTLRGGNGVQGELIGRCANGRPLKRSATRPDVGLRCCAGEANSFEVVLAVSRGEPLKWQPPDAHLAPELAKLVPDEIRDSARGRRPEDQFSIDRMWTWHPLGNEELVIGGGCAHPAGHARCGVVVARVRSDAVDKLEFISTDWWQPTLSESDSAREVFAHGGDTNGAFRRKVSYDWGRLTVLPKERKKKHKGRREPSYD